MKQGIIVYIYVSYRIEVVTSGHPVNHFPQAFVPIFLSPLVHPLLHPFKERQGEP